MCGEPWRISQKDSWSLKAHKMTSRHLIWKIFEFGFFLIYLETISLNQILVTKVMWFNFWLPKITGIYFWLPKITGTDIWLPKIMRYENSLLVTRNHIYIFLKLWEMNFFYQKSKEQTSCCLKCQEQTSGYQKSQKLISGCLKSQEQTSI